METTKITIRHILTPCGRRSQITTTGSTDLNIQSLNSSDIIDSNQHLVNISVYWQGTWLALATKLNCPYFAIPAVQTDCTHPYMYNHHSWGVWDTRQGSIWLVPIHYCHRPYWCDKGLSWNDTDDEVVSYPSSHSLIQVSHVNQGIHSLVRSLPSAIIKTTDSAINYKNHTLIG